MLYAVGLTEDDMHKPQVGIASLWWEGKRHSYNVVIETPLKRHYHQEIHATFIWYLRLLYNSIGN